MHHYDTPEYVKQAVMQRQGKSRANEVIDAARAALVVVDMQNYFVAEEVPTAVPVAREIVPNINRMAAAIRAAGGRVVWIQTTATGAMERWANYHNRMLTPENAARRLKNLAEGSDGFKLYPKLAALPADIYVKKIKYSAMIPDSSNLNEVLVQNGLDTLLITGTVTNTCCESTARDASMFDYKVIMISDGNAGRRDELHAGALNNFQLYFGDVMTTDEAIARLAPAAARKTAKGL